MVSSICLEIIQNISSALQCISWVGSTYLADYLALWALIQLWGQLGGSLSSLNLWHLTGQILLFSSSLQLKDRIFFEIPLITDDLSCPKSLGILKKSRKFAKVSIKTTKNYHFCWKFSDERGKKWFFVKGREILVKTVSIVAQLAGCLFISTTFSFLPYTCFPETDAELN